MGNRFIAVAIDYLTKYVFIKALPSKRAKDVAEFMFEDIVGCSSQSFNPKIIAIN